MPLAEQLEREYGIPIVNKRIAVTPIAQLAAATRARDLTPLALALDRAAATVGIDFIGGFSALVQKGISDADARLIASIPGALATTERVCASVNVATTRAGINMDAVLAMAQYQLKQVNEARASLAKGVASDSGDSGEFGGGGFNWIVAQLLMREAKALIEGQPAASRD